MNSRVIVDIALVAVVLSLTVTVSADEPRRDHVQYVEKTKYPVINEMEDHNEELQAAAEAKTEEILAKVREEAEARKEAKKIIRFDVSGIDTPDGPEAFGVQGVQGGCPS